MVIVCFSISSTRILALTKGAACDRVHRMLLGRLPENQYFSIHFTSISALARGATCDRVYRMLLGRVCLKTNCCAALAEASPDLDISNRQASEEVVSLSKIYTKNTPKNNSPNPNHIGQHN